MGLTPSSLILQHKLPCSSSGSLNFVLKKNLPRSRQTKFEAN